MLLTLDVPIVNEICSHRVDDVTINFDENKREITIADLDSNGIELDERTFTLPVFDSAGNAITPSAWPDSNPSVLQLYAMIQQLLLMGLQDQPGANGLGTGIIA